MIQIARDAFRSLLIFTMEVATNGGDDNPRVFWKQVIRLTKKGYGRAFSNYSKANIDPVVVHSYEAILLYATLVLSTNAEGSNYLSGRTLVNRLINMNVTSPLTGKIHYDTNGEREIAYVMRNFNEDTGKHEVFLLFPVATEEVVITGDLNFVDQDTLPPNEPRCGFMNNNPVCIRERRALDPGTLALSICGPAVFLFAGLIVLLWCLRRLTKREIDPFWWQIPLQAIDTTAHTALLGTRSTVKLHEEISAPHSGPPKAPEEEFISKPTGITSSNKINCGLYKSALVSLIELPHPKRRPAKSLPNEAAKLKNLSDPNLQKFIGIAVNDDNICEAMVAEICEKGTLHHLIRATVINLDWIFKNSLIKDLASGMAYLHSSVLRSHGFLDDLNCQIDSRFILKVSGYGLNSLRSDLDLLPLTSSQADRNFHILLWRAPELLRQTMPPAGTPAGDVYSFSILLQQIILRSSPYSRRLSAAKNADETTAKEILFEVKRGVDPPIRPLVAISACQLHLHNLMAACWEEDPAKRPTFSKIKSIILRTIGHAGDNIAGHLLRQMEQYAVELERQVSEQTHQFMEERQRSSALLQVLLPRSVAESLGRGETVAPEIYDSTTVYFGNVPGFMDAILAPEVSLFDTVRLLNKLYTLCDAIIITYDVHNVEMINDDYLIASGLPVRNGIQHAEQIASMALALKKRVASFKSSKLPEKDFQLRVGINSGPCVAGVVGLKAPRYCLFGDTVNTASRMESHGEAGKIHCTGSTYDLLETFEKFQFEPRGEISIKGKGVMLTYWITGQP